MREVTVNKDVLLERIRVNRDKHREIFEDALKGYRAQAIVELDRALDDAKNGRKIWRAIGLVKPVDHTTDYDRVIDMLENSVDTEITLDAASFGCYMRDEWGWQREFELSNAGYTTLLAGAGADD